MRFDQFLIGMVAFSLIMVGGTLFWQDMISEYNTNITTDEFSNIYNVSNEMYDISEDMRDKTLDAETQGADESWESLVKGGYSAIRLVGGGFVLVGGFAAEIQKQLGIPPFIIDFGLIVLSILIISGIIFMVFRFKG